ncbi:hypothetical protein H0H87_010802 [Tephrocybe sp. NHM501043]|nr:hypothetical protein H0H87_010802 [Tephrocybe sp. NHM501043]
MSTWSIRRSVAPRSFERLLGRNELGFYWDSQFNGTADTLQTALIENLDPTNQDLFSEDNVSRTWGHLKRQFPLLGSRVEVNNGEQISFVVAEDRLERNGPDEISFQSVTSLTEAQACIDNMVNGKRLLSDNLLARVVILARTDEINQVHVLIQVAHLITDGTGNSTLLRSFLNTLSSPPNYEECNLEQRLSLAVPSDVLIPGNKSNTRRRWQRAIGQVISANRFSKTNGGHTLPRNFTSHTQYTPARSGLVSLSFPPETSMRIIWNCRKHGITLGHALPVLAQVALARMLCRRYIRGDMTTEEWNFRRREPTLTGGPINLRPFLDREWYQKGGSTHVSLAIGFFHYKLPFMPLGSAANLAIGDDLPSVQQLLSFPRFLYRSRIIQNQAKSLFEHPLFVYIAGARSAAGVAKFREVGLNWRGKVHDEATIIPVMDQSPVFAHGGSSMGDMDGILPRYYPAEDGDSSPRRLFLHATSVRLHCRPAELYLGASTVQKRLHMSVFWDKNIYEEDAVKEWLTEIQEATEIFLGDYASVKLQVRL